MICCICFSSAKCTRITQSVARFVSRLDAHLCRVGSSPAGDIRTRLYVNGWQYPSGCGFPALKMRPSFALLQVRVKYNAQPSRFK